VFLKDIWPTNAEVNEFMAANIDRDMFVRAL
jgi:aconitase A